MRTKAIRGLLAATMAASTVAVVGVGVSSPASAASCSTWQYEVTSKTGAWAVSGLTPDGFAISPKYTIWAGYKINVPDATDVPLRVRDADGTGTHTTLMKLGTVYDTDKEKAFGNEQLLVRKDKLDYVRCW
jgi:hypothetical protein